MFKNALKIIIICAPFVFGANAQTYKVMTYNIRFDYSGDGENLWSKRKANLSDQILFYEPDIIGTQEGLSHQLTYLDSVLVDYSYVGVGRDDGKTKGEHSAIFYKTKKFQVVKTHTFWLSETPHEASLGWDAGIKRICTYALFKDLKTKQHFWLFNMHFDHISKTARKESSRLVVDMVNKINKDKYPVMLTGDYNLRPNSEPIQYLSKHFNDSKLISVTNPFGPEGTINGFKFDAPLKDRIDYIFTSKKSIKVLKYAVLSDLKDFRFPSDHLPVFIEILIGSN